MSALATAAEVLPTAFAVAPGLAWFNYRRLGWAHLGFYLSWAANAGAGLAVALWARSMSGTAVFGASVLLALYLYWRSRRKKRSVLKLAGDKSRQLIAGLVERMRDLAPIPEGARA